MSLSPRLTAFLKTASKKELEDFRFFLNHPEYEHRPVSMREFLENPLYTGKGDYIRPKIKEVLIDFFDKDRKGNPISEEVFEQLGAYEELLMIAGIGSGKSFLASKGIQYVLHRLLCLKNPQRYFNLSSKSFIAFINISSSQRQAKNVVFGEIKNRIDNSPWFQKHYMPDPRIKSVLRFPKNVFVLPLGSNEEAPLGYSIFGAVIDEASFHTTTKEKDYAEESYHQISSRITSRFGDKGKLFIITSPRYVHDFAEKKFAKDLRPSLMKKRIPTWDAIPPEQFKGPKFDLGDYVPQKKGTMIPIEYEDDFKQNPERALRDFGAVPSLSIMGLFRDPAMVQAAVNTDRRTPWDSQKKKFYSWFSNAVKYEHYDDVKRFIHVDLALDRHGKGDKAALAMGKFNGWDEIKRPDGKVEHRPKVYIDYMQVFRAKQGTEIHFKDIRERIYKIRDLGYNISKVTFDGYQSADSIQMLNNSGIKAELFSVDRNPEAYYMVKSAILEARLNFYPHPTLVRELQQLEEEDGTKIDHPHGGSKDLADAVAGVMWHCSQRTPGSGVLGA